MRLTESKVLDLLREKPVITVKDLREVSETKLRELYVSLHNAVQNSSPGDAAESTRIRLENRDLTAAVSCQKAAIAELELQNRELRERLTKEQGEVERLTLEMSQAREPLEVSEEFLPQTPDAGMTSMPEQLEEEAKAAREDQEDPQQP